MSDALPLLLIPGDDPVQIAGSPQLKRLEGQVRIQLHSDRPKSKDEQVARARDATLMINSRGQVTWSGDLLQQLPKLKFISTCSIGTDSIDLAAARERGITVSNIPGRTAPIVAEHVLALMLAAAKRVSYQTAELRAGRWTKRENVMLAGKTLGVIGTGAIGCCVAELAAAIGMQVIAWTYHPDPEKAARLNLRYVEREELLSTADVVSLHVKLTDDSRGLIDRAALARMKPGSLLINTARGPVVDTTALVESLQSGHLAGAGIDVFDEEPMSPDNPLLTCDQVVLTPHAADQTPEGVDALNAGAVDNVLAFLAGKPENVVT